MKYKPFGEVRYTWKNSDPEIIPSATFNLAYDAENRLVEVKKNNATQMKFTYDADGKRVKSETYEDNAITETILFVGSHYEVKNPGSGETVSKYYFAGTTRIAMRKYTIPQNMSVEYMLGDHLGSTSLTTDSAGNKVSEIRYKPFGETRYTWTDSALNNPANPDDKASPVYALTKYQFTGQYSYESEFGLLFYNARFYDSQLGRFTSADSIVPTSQGTQGLDRYAYVNNNPVNLTDPTGHCEKRQKDEDNSCITYLEKVEKTYGVVIDDSKGLWTLGLLGAISKGMKTLQTAMGSDAFAKLFTDVTFSIGGHGVASNGMGTTGNRDVILGSGLGPKDLLYIEHETVHELAHIWSNSCGGCMRDGMMEKTGSKYSKKWWLFGDVTYYPRGTSPTNYAAASGEKGGAEDWAESVTAYLYPKYAKNPSWTQDDRYSYVANALSNPIP